MRIFISLIILFLGTNLFASYKEALSFYETKKYAESLKIIGQEIDPKKDMDKDSPNYDLRFLAAHNHWKLGNFSAAVGHFKRCSEIRKDNPDPFIDLALLMFEIKRYGDANFFALSSIKKAENPMAYFVLGKSAYKTANYIKAKEYFEKAISLDPDFGIAYNYLGLVLIGLKKSGEANTAFSAALETMPDSAEVLNNMGISFESSGKYDEAFKYLTRAADKMPENPVIKANLNRVKGKIALPKK